MKQDLEERAVAVARYIIENRATVRMAAKEFGISKSTAHKDGGVIIRIEICVPIWTSIKSKNRELFHRNISIHEARMGLDMAFPVTYKHVTISIHEARMGLDVQVLSTRP